ncbi:hypothetical protein V2J09_013696 [Rumex salicifolius]
MEGETLERIGLTKELINRACSVAIAAHKDPHGKPFVVQNSGTSTALIGFAGSWTAEDWFFGGKPFGESTVNLHLFPSLKSIGKAEAAVVNGASLRRFEALLLDPSFISEVEKATSGRNQIVFTGHSTGAPIAIFATLWYLENHKNQSNHQLLLPPPHCITFGSPLVGDQILHHATKRENWARHFKHFITRYDIIPRVSLSPLSSIDEQQTFFRPVLHYCNPNSSLYANEYISRAAEASRFFFVVMRNAASIASHAACKFMGSTNPLLETVAQFVELSPYRPFGAYVFCAGNGKLMVVENPNAVLQLLFYSLQWASEAEAMEAAHRSLKDHLGYESELQESLVKQNVAYLDCLEDVPLTTAGRMGTALRDLGINTRARLCLRAAGELENQKMRNQMKIDNNRRKIEVGLNALQSYQERCEARKVGYYDAFKIQKDLEDFNSNVKRLELAGMWDEIIEMLKRYELPDEFEGRRDWIELGTKYRRIVEPLDIANYYHHSLNESTGPYMVKGRPNRYKFVQRWREHAMNMETQSIPESCVWAEIEELHIIVGLNKIPFENVKERIVQLERDVSQWVRTGQLGGDVFLNESTFVKWWKTLPHQHTTTSSIADLLYR